MASTSRPGRSASRCHRSCCPMVLLIAGRIELQQLPITRLPNADIPVVSVVIAQFGAAPGRTRGAGHQAVEDGVSGVEGARHISSDHRRAVGHDHPVPAGDQHRPRAERRQGRRHARPQPICRSNINEPLIQRVDIVGLPILTYAASRPARRRNSSPGSMSTTWSSARCKACAALPRSSASAASSARSASPSIRIGCRRSA